MHAKMPMGIVAVVDGAWVSRIAHFDQFVVPPVTNEAVLLFTSRITVWRAVSAFSPVWVSLLTKSSPLASAMFREPCTYNAAFGAELSLPQIRCCPVVVSVSA